MSNTFTFTDLIESEAGKFTPTGVAKEAVKQATSGTDNMLTGIIPDEWIKPIGRLISNFAENPQKFERTILGQIAFQNQDEQVNYNYQPQTQPPPISAPTPPAAQQPDTQPAQIQPAKQPPDFEHIYSQITAGVEKAISLQGDLPLSEILKELQAETYKPLLKQIYDGWF